MKSFHDLEAWQLAMALAERVYTVTKAFPKHELFGMTSQLRRTAVSVPSNIAEGQGRTNGEWLQFLGHARGSLNELETQLALAVRLGYLSSDNHDAIHEVQGSAGRSLNGLITYVRRRTPGKPANGKPPATSN